MPEQHSAVDRHASVRTQQRWFSHAPEQHAVAAEQDSPTELQHAHAE